MVLLLTRDCSSDDEHRDCSQPGWYCFRKSFSMLKACEHATRLLTRLVTSTKTRDFKRDVSFVYIPLCHENLALVTRRSPRTSGPRDYCETTNRADPARAGPIILAHDYTKALSLRCHELNCGHSHSMSQNKHVS